MRWLVLFCILFSGTSSVIADIDIYDKTVKEWNDIKLKPDDSNGKAVEWTLVVNSEMDGWPKDDSGIDVTTDLCKTSLGQYADDPYHPVLILNDVWNPKGFVETDKKIGRALVKLHKGYVIKVKGKYVGLSLSGTINIYVISIKVIGLAKML